MGILLSNTLKAQLPLPVYAPCGASATITGVVNTYYPGLNDIHTGEVTISLGAPVGNAAPLVRGDRILIIQMQDAAINSSNTAAYGGNGADGNGLIDLGYSGQYEFAQVRNFTAGVLTLRNPLQHNYRAVSGIPNRKSTYQVVRVPVYKQAILGGTLTAFPWNGNAGGIIALHAWQTLDLNGNGISAAGSGFRPGKINSAGGLYNLQDYVRTTYGSYGEKGEGIAGTPLGTWAATAGGYENGSFGRGAPANAGGGGNAHNSGGGGGANFGDGGKGGYQYSGPQDVGGRGGKGIKTSLPGRIIMGGGGGGGQQNNSVSTRGGNGGGIILLSAPLLVFSCSSVAITAQGETIATPSGGNDGQGGGGAGGTIVLSVATYSAAGTCTLQVNASGSNGVRSTDTYPHSGGGGGGEGTIIFSTAVPSMVNAAAGPGQGGPDCASCTTGGSAGATLAGNIFTAQNPLAIDLLKFDASCEEGEVAISWTTAHEENSAYFGIDHSTDAQSWTEIARIPASGTSHKIRHYSTVHRPQSDGQMQYYRLREVDLQQRITTWQTIDAVCENNGELQIFPVPANDRLYIKSPDDLRKASLSLYTVSGQQPDLAPAYSDNGHEAMIDVSHLAAGVYVVCYTAPNGKPMHQKILICK